jgi:hypothetical protein
MKRISFFLMSYLFTYVINAQIPYLFPSSTTAAGASVADIKCWSAFHNPAPLAGVYSPQLYVQAENRYIITELSAKSFSIAYPSSQFVSAFSFSHFGFSLYHEMLLGIAFARNFSGKFSLGVQFNYFTTYFLSSNSYHGAFFPQIGLNIPLNKNIQLGFHVFNPFQTNVKSDLTTKRLPAIFSLGCASDFSENLVWRFQADKEISSNYRFATAFDYSLTEEVRFQTGIYGFEYLIPCLGFGYHLKNFSVDLITELHPLLGLTTLAGIKYRFPSKRL